MTRSAMRGRNRGKEITFICCHLKKSTRGRRARTKGGTDKRPLAIMVLMTKMSEKVQDRLNHVKKKSEKTLEREVKKD